jgi:hypothetical protein
VWVGRIEEATILSREEKLIAEWAGWFRDLKKLLWTRQFKVSVDVLRGWVCDRPCDLQSCDAICDVICNNPAQSSPFTVIGYSVARSHLDLHQQTAPLVAS